MKTLQFNIKGIAPLIMHSNRAVNQLGKEYKAMKPLTSKRSKTEEDLRVLARLEWEAGLYIHEGKIVLPAKCVLACITEGAKRSKLGKTVTRAIFPLEDFFPFLHDGPKVALSKNGEFPNDSLDALFEINRYEVPVKIGTKTIMRTRPIFYKWSSVATFLFDENEINESSIMMCAEQAGQYIGLLDWRPLHGRFEVEKVK